MIVACVQCTETVATLQLQLVLILGELSSEFLGHGRVDARRVRVGTPAEFVGGIGVFEVAEEAIRMHRDAFGDSPVLASMLDAGGEYAFRIQRLTQSSWCSANTLGSALFDHSHAMNSPKM